MDHLEEINKKSATKVFRYWHDRLGGEVQGACAIIAMEIYKTHMCDNTCSGMNKKGGCNDQCLVAGYLTSATGWRRAHWWIEKDGVVYDPMGEKYKNEPGFKRVVEHRGHWDDFVAEYRRQKENIPCH